MTDKKNPEADAKAKAAKEADAEALPTPETFHVRVLNIVSGKTTELFGRECAFGKRMTAMKGIRQKIRDMGTTIRNAEVTDSSDLGKKDIVFTELVVPEKKTVTRTSTTSNARKNAEDTVKSNTDLEIIGIVKDDDLDAKTIHDELNKYTRHQLIHAWNTFNPDNKLTHYSKKTDAISALSKSSK